MAAYLKVPDIQGFLNDRKFTPSSIDDEVINVTKGTIFGKLAQRYDTSGWIDESSTPELVISIMAMWYAGFYLRRTASEEDGLTSYADWLQKSAVDFCDGIVDGSILLEGVDPDDTSALGGGPEFFPTDDSTQLWQDNHSADGSSTEEGASTLAFTMQMRF